MRVAKGMDYKSTRRRGEEIGAKDGDEKERDERRRAARQWKMEKKSGVEEGRVGVYQWLLLLAFTAAAAPVVRALSSFLR
jgi:hypothetical protein